MIDRRYRINLTNENSEAWFETSESGKVLHASENILRHINGLDIGAALDATKSRGWDVASWTQI